MEFACFLKEIVFTFIKDIDFQFSFPVTFLSVSKVFGAPWNRGETTLSCFFGRALKDQCTSLLSV